MKALASTLTFFFLFGHVPSATAGTIGTMFGYTPTGTQQLILTTGGTQMLSAVFTGWWDSTGFHDAGNPNYATGQQGGTYFRDFFVFDLSVIEETITGAQLSIGNNVAGYAPGIPAWTSTYSMFDVSTSIAELYATNTGQVAIFEDLGSGTLFASRAVSAADNGTQVLITLNDSAIAALNLARGQEIAIGGVVDSVPEPGTVILFGSALAGLLCLRRLIR